MKHIEVQSMNNRMGRLAIVMMAGLGAMFFVELAGAAQTAGELAQNVTSTFGDLAKLITAAAYVAGLGFAIGAVLKFKQHKDNPTQIPVGTPIALLFIAAALIFLPTIFGITGATLFGSSGGTVGGPSGIIFS